MIAFEFCTYVNFMAVESGTGVKGRVRRTLRAIFRGFEETPVPPPEVEPVAEPVVEPPSHRTEDGGEEQPSCRVCYGEHGPLLPNNLIKPCACRGELQWIHRRCLYNWMEAKPGIGATKSSCEICKATIDTKTLLGPLRGDVCDEDVPASIDFFPFFGKRNVSLTM